MADLQRVEQYKQLWCDVFKDDKEFVEQYFDVFCNDKSFHYIANKHNLISALLSCDYSWYCWQTQIPFAYLSGIVTNEDFRRQGYGSKLILNSFDKLCNDYYLCGLIAEEDSLKDYYQKFSFISLPDKKEEIFNRIDINRLLIDTYFLIKDADITSSNYSRCFTYRDYSISHTFNTLSLYNQERYLRFAITYQGTLRAFTVGLKTKNFIELLDLYAVNSQAKYAMLSLLAHTYKKDIKTLAQKNAMIRILNVRKLLEIYAKQNCAIDLSLHIEDRLIANNNITVRIHDSIVEDVANSYRIKSISIEDLTTLLFPQGNFFLMLDR